MAGRTAVLGIKIVTDASQGAAGLQQAAGGVSKFSRGLQAAAAPAAIAGAAVLAFGKQAVDAASLTQQAMGAVDTVFGKNAGQIKAWSDQAATSVGLSKSQYGSLAAVLGASLKGMGVSTDELAGKSNALITMGADLAATFGGTTKDAVDALGSALRGEMDPLDKYGIQIKEADIAAQMAADGTDKLTGAAEKQARTTALLTLITKGAAPVMGQFARETDSAAGSAQVAASQWENAQSALGEALLPAVAAVSTALGGLAQFMTDNAGLTQGLIIGIAALSAAILVANGVMKAYAVVSAVIGVVQKANVVSTVASTAAMLAQRAAMLAVSVATKAYAAAQWLLNAAMTANPIGLIIVAVVALVAAIVLAYNKSETFRNIVNAVFREVARVVTIVAGVLRKVWDVAFEVVSAYVRAYAVLFKAIFNAIKVVVQAVARVYQTVWKAAVSAVTRLVQAYRTTVTAIFTAIRAVVVRVATGVRTAWANAINAIKRAVALVKAAIIAAFNAVKGPIAAAARWISTQWTNAINAIKRVMSGLGAILSAPFNAVKNAISAAIGLVQDLINKISNIRMPSISLPSWLPGDQAMMVPAPATAGLYGAPRAAAAPMVAGAGRSTRTTSGGGSGALGGVTINVTGALDPDAVARQIERVLARRSRRIGGIARAAGAI